MASREKEAESGGEKAGMSVVRCEEKKLIEGEGSRTGGLIVSRAASAWMGSNTIPQLATRVSQGDHQADLTLCSLLLMCKMFQYLQMFYYFRGSFVC